MHNTLKLVGQIVYMLIVGGLQGSGVDFSEENQEFYWLYCRYTVYVVAMSGAIKLSSYSIHCSDWLVVAIAICLKLHL